jgi:hypothetical protein
VISAPAARSAAPLPTTCAGLTAEIKRTEARWVGVSFTCATDADCICYGGPACPNALVTTCPSPIGSNAGAELEPLVRAWVNVGCGFYLWSPSRCEAACLAGTCGNRAP